MNLPRKGLSEIKQKAAQFFSSKPDVRFAFLFGSLAERKDTPLSDVDLAVYVDERVPSQEAHEFVSKLTTELMGVLKTNEIDLVLLNEAPPLLRHRILTRGESLFVRDPIQEQRFFVRSLQDYFDTAPLRSIQARYLREYIGGLHKPQKN